MAMLDERAMKVCRRCGERKSLTEYSKNPTGKDGLRSECRACRYLADRDYLLKVRFGIDSATYDRLLAAQGGGCALCGSTNPGGRWTSFHVDHCHDTGRVRGLLCAYCNGALGTLGDSPEALLRAYEYVAGDPLQRQEPA